MGKASPDVVPKAHRRPGFFHFGDGNECIPGFPIRSTESPKVVVPFFAEGGGAEGEDVPQNFAESAGDECDK